MGHEEPINMKIYSVALEKKSKAKNKILIFFPFACETDNVDK